MKQNRKEMEDVLNAVLREYIEHDRISKGLSQRKMAEILSMETRSYANIEAGGNCSALTALLFILQFDNRDALLGEMEEKLSLYAMQV